MTLCIQQPCICSVMNMIFMHVRYISGAFYLSFGSSLIQKLSSHALFELDFSFSPAGRN